MIDHRLGEKILDEARNALARSGPGRVSKGTLRRIVSSAYYGVFHEFLRISSDIGVGRAGNRQHPSWKRVYRSIDHVSARKACNKARNDPARYCAEICRFAEVLKNLQTERIRADYDPGYEVTKATAEARVRVAIAAIADLRRVEGSGPGMRDQLKEFVFLALVKNREELN